MNIRQELKDCLQEFVDLWDSGELICPDANIDELLDKAAKVLYEENYGSEEEDGC